MEAKYSFMHALENNNMVELRKIPKADLHAHSWSSGCRQFIFEKTGRWIEPIKHKLVSLHEMDPLSNEVQGNSFNDYENYKILVEAIFVQACNDGVTLICIGESTGTVKKNYNDDMDLYVSTWMGSRRYAPNTKHLFQIGFVRHKPIDIQLEKAAKFFDRDCFAAIDLYGDEFTEPIEKFKPVFRKAKNKGMILRAHVGEFGTADDIWRAVEELELDEVQHGIAAASSTQVMNYLANNNIRLNICPTSNIILNRVDSLINHPIRKLFDNGVKVTVNTDNLLIFGNTLSQEFMTLYDCGLFSAEELNTIRENSFI